MSQTRVPLHQRVLTEEQRQAIAHREAERQRLAAIFTPTGSLNMEAIQLLIGWAAQDEAALRDYSLWGIWDQGHWGLAEMDLDRATARAIVDEYDTTDVDAEAADDLINKTILNGACQSAYCMAGQAVAQAGFKLNYNSAINNDMHLMVTADTCVRVEPVGTFDDKGYPVMREVGEPTDISEAAQEVLGLTDEQGDLFFNGGNGIVTLKRLANRFALDAHMEVPYPDHDVFPYDD